MYDRLLKIFTCILIVGVAVAVIGELGIALSWTLQKFGWL